MLHLTLQRCSHIEQYLCSFYSWRRREPPPSATRGEAHRGRGPGSRSHRNQRGPAHARTHTRVRACVRACTGPLRCLVPLVSPCRSPDSVTSVTEITLSISFTFSRGAICLHSASQSNNFPPGLLPLLLLLLLLFFAEVHLFVVLCVCSWPPVCLSVSFI